MQVLKGEERASLSITSDPTRQTESHHQTVGGTLLARKRHRLPPCYLARHLDEPHTMSIIPLPLLLEPFSRP
jgi:hypothetical protein